MNLRSKLPTKLRQFATVGALIKLPLLLPAMLVVGIFILLRPFVIIQVHKVHDWRFGHMVPNTDMTLLHAQDWNKSHRRKMKVILFFPSDNAANNYYKKMIIRDNYALQKNFGFLIYYLASYFSFLISDLSFEDPQIMEVLFKNPPTLNFTPAELDLGYSFLKSFGLKTHEKFVCLFARDPEYFAQMRPNSKKFTKHNLRNSDIATYVPAAENLAENGYTVFRMGALVERPLISDNKKIIDYATNGMRTEFLDIFLGAHCTFCITNGAGWDEIPKLFKRPTMFVNIIPYWQAHHCNYNIIRYPKLLIDISDGHIINLAESLSRNIASEMHAGRIHNFGATYKDLGPDEIKEAVQEMVARVEGHFITTDQQLITSKKIMNELNTNATIQPSPGFYPIRAEYSSAFLIRNPSFFI